MDIGYQRFPDYDYEDDKVRLRQQTVVTHLETFERDRDIREINLRQERNKQVVNLEYLNRISELKEENADLKEKIEELEKELARLGSGRNARRSSPLTVGLFGAATGNAEDLKNKNKLRF